jgi:hypothetical protein
VCRYNRERLIEPWDFVGSSPEPEEARSPPPSRRAYRGRVSSSSLPSAPAAPVAAAATAAPADAPADAPAAPYSSSPPPSPPSPQPPQPPQPHKNTNLRGFAAAVVPLSFAAPTVDATPRRGGGPLSPPAAAAAVAATPVAQGVTQQGVVVTPRGAEGTAAGLYKMKNAVDT